MRYLGKTLYEAEIMTLREYTYEMHAFLLRKVDSERSRKELAWDINQVQATERKGKKIVPVFKKFRDFYDFENRIAEIKHEVKSKTDKTLSALLRKANS